mmetsp:Transcript_3120/g.6790  ORF Transcript_3120/g.6790 Transcript_3120/m.6790 type:complete len:269 (-) Transcript_3120:28-834(-)
MAAMPLDRLALKSCMTRDTRSRCTTYACPLMSSTLRPATRSGTAWKGTLYTPSLMMMCTSFHSPHDCSTCVMAPCTPCFSASLTGSYLRPLRLRNSLLSVLLSSREPNLALNSSHSWVRNHLRRSGLLQYARRRMKWDSWSLRRVSSLSAPSICFSKSLFACALTSSSDLPRSFTSSIPFSTRRRSKAYRSKSSSAMSSVGVSVYKLRSVCFVAFLPRLIGAGSGGAPRNCILCQRRNCTQLKSVGLGLPLVLGVLLSTTHDSTLALL